MRGIQIPNHQAHHAPHLVRRGGGGHQRPVLLARGFPVDAVEGRIEEVVAQKRPRFAEHLHLFSGEVRGEFRGDGKRARLAALSSRNLDASALEVIHLPAVGTELRVGFRVGGGGQLSRHRTLDHVIERIGVEVGLSGRNRRHQRKLPVRTDRDRLDVQAERQQGQAVPDPVEHRFNWRGRSGVRSRRR